jgi:alkylation response protein AidB-like acyl-CoA dehydrogenase
LLFFGLSLAGPTVVTHGDDDVRRRLLRPMFTGEEIWCQLFSEPGAGSDFASLATRAVRDGDEWVVNGQKVWNTLAHLADRGMLVTRTDPDLPKHKGLTYFAVDMHAPGVEVRPLRQITGEAEFNEVYLTDVRVPDADRIGGVGDGWRVAMTTLMNERVTIGGSSGGSSGPKRGSGAIAEAVRIWKDRADDDPALKDRLMQLWVDAETLRLTNLRAAAQARVGNPGPEGIDRETALRRDQQGDPRVLHHAPRTGRARRLRLRDAPLGSGRPRRAAGFVAQDVPAVARELDRGRHVGDHAQHPRRAGARPAGRTSYRPRPAVVAGPTQLTREGR